MFAKLSLFLILVSITTLSSSKTLDKRLICTWDPVGQNGPVMAFFSDLIPKAISWGLDLNFIPYEDESSAIKDLSSGKCDAATVTAILSRDFVPFAGTLDAIGGVTSEQNLKQTLVSIASPKATEAMSEGEYEVVASLPVGSMFAFVNDRKIQGINNFKGKHMAILNGDIQARKFAELSGARPVDTTLSTFHHLFNTKKVDIVLMPALAYNTFELYRGLGDKGGILDIRLFYGMLQTISRKSAFPDDFGTKMRRYMASRLDTMINLINNAERNIPPRYWIRTSQASKDELNDFYKDIRLNLKVKNQFDSKALFLLWKIRCVASPEMEECEMPK